MKKKTEESLVKYFNEKDRRDYFYFRQQISLEEDDNISELLIREENLLDKPC